MSPPTASQAPDPEITAQSQQLEQEVAAAKQAKIRVAAAREELRDMEDDLQRRIGRIDLLQQQAQQPPDTGS